MLSNRYIFFVLGILFIIQSCSIKDYKLIYRDVPYNKPVVTEYSNQPPDYRLQPYDRLYITIRSRDKDIDELFSMQSRQASINYNNRNGSSSYLTGYMVNDTGYVRIPVIGDLYVEGLTLSEAEKLVQAEVDKILVDALVMVKLLSFKIYFMGEINSNGPMIFYQEHVNILEAIANAGGIGPYGDKRHVMIIRQVPTGKQIFDIDITNRNILTSEYFYLQPNDMIYVQPIKTKGIRMALSEYSVYMSIITTAVSTISTFLLLKDYIK